MTTLGAEGALGWHDQTRLLGVLVHAYFFEPEELRTRDDSVEWQLPVFRRARPRLLAGDDPRPMVAAGDLWALPDAVLEHGNGLLSLTYRNTARWWLHRERWPGQLRVDGMLQAIADAMAVAGARQRPCAALLRAGNALLQFSPSPQVLECLASNIGAARRHWNASQAISASQLASFCEPLLRTLPGIRAPEAPAALSAVPSD